MTETSNISKRPQLKTSFSFSLTLNNVLPESSNHKQFNESPLNYSPQENNNSSYINNKKSKSNTFSSIFANSRSSSFINRLPSETYQENDEFTNRCFGFFRTLGSRINYR